MAVDLQKQAVYGLTEFYREEIRDARLVMLDSAFFPDATSEVPENGEGYLDFWQRVEATWMLELGPLRE